MDKIKYWFKNMSIKKSFIMTMLSFTILATGVSALAVTGVEVASENIKMKYDNNSSVRYYLTTEDGKRLGNGAGIIENYIEPNYSELDKKLMGTLDVLKMALIPIIYISSSIFAALFFYNLKLKIPIACLNHASNNIANDNLDMAVEYTSEDELGRLCDSFEKMRSTLVENNIKMWRLTEERRRLNAAFAHDLRTPLTVLKGYNELMIKKVNSSSVEKSKLLSNLLVVERHIKRLENYVCSVSSMQKLEELEPDYKSVDVEFVITNLKETANIIKQDKEVNFSIINYTKYTRTSIDFDLFVQVFENLMSNALRYCNKKVDVMLKICEQKLVLQVVDDGEGFSSQGIKNATNAFYHEGKSEDSFGLGLYICNLICKKHNGRLRVGNMVKSGALVIAEFGF